MSYILEALRRAERERQVSKIPTVESLTHTSPAQPSRVPLRVWLLGGTTLALAAAALLVALWPRPQPAAAVIAPPAPSAAPAAPVEAPPRPAARVAPTGIEDDGALQSFDDLAAEPDTAAPSDDAPAARTVSPRQAPPDIPAPGETIIRPGSGFAAAPAPAAPTPTEPAPAAPAAPAGISALRDMPDAYRAQFPVRALDVHVYDTDPARRWIMVGGHRYSEGQTVDGGARIAQITESGVVFDYQNALVLLPVR